MMPPTSIDGTDITGATIDGQDVQEITVDGQTVFTAGPDIPDIEGNHEWLMDEGTGSTAADRVASADMSLTISGWVSGVGVGDFVIDLDGVNDGGTVSQGDINDSGDSGAIMLQCKPRDLDQNESRSFWTHADQGQNSARNYLWARGTGSTNLEWGLGGSSTITSHGLEIQDLNNNEWNGVCGVWDNGDFDLYLYDFATDTLTSGSGTYSGSVSLVTDYQFGSRTSSSQFFDGQMDFPRWFDGALTESEVQSKFEEIADFYS